MAPTSERLTSRVLDDLELPLPGRRAGKVRISWALENHQRLFVTTDRLSAFDRILGCVPGKGQMLNELSWWWFGELRHLVPHHAIAVPDPNVLIARSAIPLPVEVIVRGAITGVTTTSLWQRYNDGQRAIDGHRLPDGLQKNELLPAPIITPTTKAEAGGHDEPLSVADVVVRGLVDAEMWADMCAAALAVFAHGSAVAERAGLVLADTKYEFGLDEDGQLMLIDEVHTPDSSRYWEGSTYAASMSAGIEPQSLDKEIIRRAYADLGFRGEGDAPVLAGDVWDELAVGYRRAFERITGAALQPVDLPADQRITRTLSKCGYINNDVAVRGN